MDQTKKYRNRGFTLIELALYGGLLGILLLVLSQFFIAILDVQLTSSSDSALEQDSKYIMQRMTYDVRRMKSVSAPTLGQTGNALSGIITDPGGDTTYSFASSSGNLYVTIGGVATRLNSDGTTMTAFSVSRIGNSGQLVGAKDTIQLLFTVQSVIATPSAAKSLSTQTTISLR